MDIALAFGMPGPLEWIIIAALGLLIFGKRLPDNAVLATDSGQNTELAARHSVPLNTMRTWLRRSLLQLRECLGG
jgi:hypothetical protein